VQSIKYTSYSDQLYSSYLRKHSPTVPSDLLLNERLSRAERNIGQEEITGCIRFLASLSRVDGLIWLNQRLELQAFGVEIITPNDPNRIYLAKNPNATIVNDLNPNNFGTRHRSMFRYCATNPEALGLVVSQDGDVRAVMQFNKKVFVWDNVRIQLLKNVRLSSPKSTRSARAKR
jgi:hypothetical protein